MNQEPDFAFNTEGCAMGPGPENPEKFMIVNIFSGYVLFTGTWWSARNWTKEQELDPRFYDIIPCDIED